MTLTVLPLALGIARLDPNGPVPPWALNGAFSSVVRTPDELSVVCEASAIPPECRAEVGWQAFRVAGPLDFALTGVLASIAMPLASAHISIFAISTFDTDYVLVRSADCPRAAEALRSAGHMVGDSPTPAPVVAGGSMAADALTVRVVHPFAAADTAEGLAKTPAGTSSEATAGAKAGGW